LIKTIELLARNYGEQGNHKKAIEELEELISLRKKSNHNEVNQIDNIKTFNDLYRQYCKLGDRDKEITALEDRLLLINEHHLEFDLIALKAKNKLAKHLRLLHRNEEAQVLLNDVVACHTLFDDIEILEQVLHSMNILCSAYEYILRAENIIECSTSSNISISSKSV